MAETLQDVIERLMLRVERLESSLKRESRRRQLAEATLRRRGGDAAIAEAEAAYLRAKLTHESESNHSFLQSKCEAQRKEIVRLTSLLPRK